MYSEFMMHGQKTSS